MLIYLILYDKEDDQANQGNYHNNNHNKNERILLRTYLHST